ncbi:MAG: DUF342 domain-containing protein [Lachnospiraceae bacterium]|nr:DUF342 domain-containing protein [Lachnospiraceae bacterium]
MMNGYFRLLPGNGVTYIELHAPTEGGAPLDPSEVMSYLKVRNITFESNDLVKAVGASATGDQKLALCRKNVMPERESCSYSVSEDEMTATARFYAGSPGAESMTEDEVLSDLKNKGIIFGIDRNVIHDLFTGGRQYCTDIIVATGKPAREGQDGFVEYLFDTDMRAKPKLNEDGSVDFFHLDILRECKEGDILAVLHPADPGEAGETVFGKAVSPRDVKNAHLDYGRNVTVKDDGQSLVCAKDGHIEFISGRVSVSDVLLLANVNPATGDVDYDGNIEIEGNVASNYTVKASGNINVKGVVEAAEIIAGGNVIIARGMNGMGKGTINAGGNIVSKFLENVDVKAGGYVASESIMHCHVDAGTDIQVDGKRGFISGGRVSAKHMIHAKNLGSQMGGDTIVEVGNDPGVKGRLREIEERLLELQKTQKTVAPVISAWKQKLQEGQKLPPEKVQQIQALVKTLVDSEKEAENLNEEYLELKDKVKNVDTAYVQVHDDVYPGTRICIGDTSVTVKSPQSFCRFVRDRGDVRTKPY